MLADFTLGLASPEVALLEVFNVGRMNGPVVALAVSTAAGLDEAVVERQVVADAVAPAGTTGTEICIIVQYILINITQHQFLVGRTEDGHGDEADVAVLRLGLLLGPVETRIELGRVRQEEGAQVVSTASQVTESGGGGGCSCCCSSRRMSGAGTGRTLAERRRQKRRMSVAETLTEGVVVELEPVLIQGGGRQLGQQSGGRLRSVGHH